jgi:hypothetical protein
MIFLGAEIILHIYNPFIRKNAADKIELHPNRNYGMRNIAASNNLVQDITLSTNSLGFRGSEPDDKTDTDDKTLHTSKAMSLWS